jgi:hypothetical protein
MNWVLIVLFLHNGEGNLAATSAVFETQALCEAAGKKASSDLDGVFTGVHYSCVQARNETPAAAPAPTKP